MKSERIAIVTGATRGIGLEVAKNLSSDFCIIAVSKKGNFDDLKKEIGQDHIFIQADVSSQEDVKKIFSDIKSLDVLINNAGLLRDANVGMISDQMMDEVLDTNVKSVIRLSQYAAKFMMRRQSGQNRCIVNVSSIMGIYGNIGQTVYSASKSAVLGITKSMSKELASYGIRVNAVCPGLVNTDMVKQIPHEKLKDLVSRTSLKRMASPKEIADVICFLASNSSSYITGQAIEVDGGMLL